MRAVGGGLLLVSQFTLAADTRSGTRPGFSTAAAPERARELFDYLVAQARAAHPEIATGEFGADMQVSLVNDGPVTFWLETHAPDDPEVIEFEREVYCAAGPICPIIPPMFELLIIAVVLLLVFGASKVRSAGSDLGAAVKGFRKGVQAPPGRPPRPAESLAGCGVPRGGGRPVARERQARCLR